MSLWALFFGLLKSGSSFHSSRWLVAPSSSWQRPKKASGYWATTSGQLSLGHTNSALQLTPATVPWKGPQPVQVEWGGEHSLVLEAEGGVWQAGSSRFSASPLTFERVPEVPPMTLVAAGFSHSASLNTEGGLWVWTCKEDLSWARLIVKLFAFPKLAEGLISPLFHLKRVSSRLRFVLTYPWCSA